MAVNRKVGPTEPLKSLKFHVLLGSELLRTWGHTGRGGQKKRIFFHENMFFLGVGDVEYAWPIFWGSCEPPVIKKCPFGPYHRCIWENSTKMPIKGTCEGLAGHSEATDFPPPSSQPPFLRLAGWLRVFVLVCGSRALFDDTHVECHHRPFEREYGLEWKRSH